MRHARNYEFAALVGNFAMLLAESTAPLVAAAERGGSDVAAAKEIKSRLQKLDEMLDVYIKENAPAGGGH